MSVSYEDLLAYLDISLDPSKSPALFATDSKTRQQLMEMSGHAVEIIALERAARFGVDHVYFRYGDNNVPDPVVWLYNRCNPAISGDLKPEEMADLHRRIWSAGDAPLVFVFQSTTIDIFHVLQGPDWLNGQLRAHPWLQFDLINEAAEIAKKLNNFSAHLLDSGRLWEEHPDTGVLRSEGAAFMALASELQSCMENLVLVYGMPEAIVKRLLIMFVLIQYLDERRDVHGNGVFPPGTFERHASGAQCFVDLVRSGSLSVISFVDELADKDRLNGKFFALTQNEKEQLNEGVIRYFAEFLEGRNQGSQMLLWRKYAFSELPVELISHLYEQFLPHEPGVVYTPPFLVQFILDEVLPVSELTPDGFRILDPACGSGVFLVGAFKRLVQRWRIAHGLANPSVATLQAILREHIYGIDVREEAVMLTIFGLSVALCDFLEPRVIWEELHFEDLANLTLLQGDFFEVAHSWEKHDSGMFDLIVGNPPFESALSDAAKGKLRRVVNQFPKYNLPDKQIALLFLEQSMNILKISARLAIIQPAAPLLYNNGSHNFRRHLLERFSVPMVVDFSALSRVLFKRAASRVGRDGSKKKNPGDIAVAIVFIENHEPDDLPLLHVTVRRTNISDMQLGIEIDHYDFHRISQKDAKNDPYIWKSNLIGGGRNIHLIQKLNKLQPLRLFLKRMQTEHSWDFGDGYIRGDVEKISRIEELEGKHIRTEKERQELAKLRKRYRRGPWLTDKLAINNKYFTSENTYELLPTEHISERYFAEPRRPSLFLGPVLLIKKIIEANTNFVPVYISIKDINFNDSVYGIHFPASDIDLAESLAEVFKSPIFVFYVISTSSKFAVARSTNFNSMDIMNFPYIPKDNDLISELDYVLMEDAISYFLDSRRKGPGAHVYSQPKDKDLEYFSEWFCRVLGPVYPMLQSGKHFTLRGAVAVPFWFGEPEAEFEHILYNEPDFNEILHKEMGAAVYTKRIIRIFIGNLLLFIKPNQLRYWLRSIAIRDADEAFAYLNDLDSKQCPS